MAHKVGLVGYGYFDIAINNNTLAGQARCDFGADGTVDKVFFLIRYFLYVIHTFGYIYLAGAATAYAAAIVLQVYSVLEANIQYRLAFRYRQFDRLVVFFLKVYFNAKNVHRVQK